MNKLTSKQVRRMWLDFFESKQHKVIDSKSLIPVNDPSLLWINSGVATLKDYFSGAKTPPAPRLTNSQRSIRTNDIENVGVTARHHTLFEMLGNFSIGDYFKKEVQEFATELLFDVYKLDKEKVYITYFEEDQETYDGWIANGIDPSHLIKGDRDMNFWDIGSGPCGPDTEIFYDRGEKYDFDNVGIELLEKDLENDRYVEIWNIVFSQFNNDGEGNYSDLAQKNIDTGAGLERLTSIFQDAPTNFDTDLFMHIMHQIEEHTDKTYITENYFTQDPVQTKINKSFKIIADHARSVTIAIHDGAIPSNTGRGYIIRRLLRRAMIEMRSLGIKDTKETFLSLMPLAFDSVGMDQGDKTPIVKVIEKEVNSFNKTLAKGTEMIEEFNAKGENVSPEVVFELFATYGFPLELSIDLLNNPPKLEDVEEFKVKHANASRGSKDVKGMASQINVIQQVTEKISEFVGYTSLEEDTKVVFRGEENGKHYVLLEKTPFYATGGGQKHDEGLVDGQEVEDVFKDKHGNNWLILNNAVQTNVRAIVNKSVRLDKERNHSATHLMAYALEQVFGDGTQLGSSNDEDKLRYDFPSDKRPTKEQLVQVEQIVNGLIGQGINLDTNNDVEYPIAQGLAMGAKVIPGEDYGDFVRVVKFGDIIDFCGGTHIANTKLIEAFKITKVDSKGSGTYRIEAITSKDKVDSYNKTLLNGHVNLLKVAIAKAKKLNDKYVIKFEESIEGVLTALDKVKQDTKKLLKASKNTKVDTSQYQPVEVDGRLTLEVEVSPAEVKSMAIQLREAFPKALIIAKAPQAKLVALASQEYNVLEIKELLFPNLKGGGNDKFIMGKDI